jgi:hypothetical protein
MSKNADKWRSAIKASDLWTDRIRILISDHCDENSFGVYDTRAKRGWCWRSRAGVDLDTAIPVFAAAAHIAFSDGAPPRVNIDGCEVKPICAMAKRQLQALGDGRR